MFLSTFPSRETVHHHEFLDPPDHWTSHTSSLSMNLISFSDQLFAEPRPHWNVMSPETAANLWSTAKQLVLFDSMLFHDNNLSAETSIDLYFTHAKNIVIGPKTNGNSPVLVMVTWQNKSRETIASAVFDCRWKHLTFRRRLLRLPFVTLGSSEPARQMVVAF